MKTMILNVSLFLFALGVPGGLALAGSSSGSVASTATNPPPHSTKLPSALRPALYRALAKDAGPTYSLNKAGCAVLPRSNLKACFDSGGAHFSGAGSPLALHLVAFGRGNMLLPIKPVRPAIHVNQVNYNHGNLTEWWRVLPVGFEQGFTLARRPTGNGELTLALTMNNKASLRNGVLRWGKLRYGKLVVTDANGKVVPAKLKSKDNRIMIAVNDVHAVYPITVDPLVWLEQEVTAADGAEGDGFGVSVTLDSDDTTALVGAWQWDGNQGAAYVFSKAGGTWTQTQKLTAADGGAGDLFGASVALDSDGTTALIGADCIDVCQGAAYVFSKAGGTWTQTQKLTVVDDDGAAYYFGWSVALDSDGTTALVGANGKNSYQGAAYVFSESGGTWTQTQELTAADGAAGDLFGWSVALNSDGTTALVSAANKNDGQGAAYVFSESGGTWAQTQELTAADGAEGDLFGYSVALDSDGTTALVGVPAKNSHQGAAYVFSESGGTWTQTQELTAADGAGGDYFGHSVALDSDGTTALVGVPAKNSYQGAAYVFSESGGTWAQIQELTVAAGDLNNKHSVALDSDGTTALVGASHTNDGRGAAYFENQSDLGLILSAPNTVGQGQQYTSQTIATNSSSVASPAVSATITVPAAASFISATATQGSCSQASGIVTCDFGQIDGNAGTATANVTLKATGNVGDTIENVAGVAKATPPLSASAPTTITAGGVCPAGYTEYDGTLNPGEVARSPVYQAPGGSENAILTAPAGFELYAVHQSGRFGRHVYRVPGNEVHRWGPKGLYMWLVRARDGTGAYTLCLLHP